MMILIITPCVLKIMRKLSAIFLTCMWKTLHLKICMLFNKYRLKEINFAKTRKDQYASFFSPDLYVISYVIISNFCVGICVWCIN